MEDEFLGAVKEVLRGYRNRVLNCRLVAGIKTLKEFSERTRIPASTLSEIESNKRFLTSPHAIRISEVLGVSLDELYEGSPGQGADIDDE